MKTSLPCGQSGCDYVAVHKNQNVAKRMIGYHRRVVHGIPGAHTARNKKYSKRKKDIVKPASTPTQGGNQMIHLDCVFQSCPWCQGPIRALVVAANHMRQHEETE